MTPTQRERIIKHGLQLLAIFPNATERDPMTLCKRLRRIETAFSRVSLAYCNGTTTEAEIDRAAGNATSALARLLRPGSVPLHLNRDPRGYALKIDDEYTRAHGLDLERDGGEYGILAPDLTA